jgi:hypothetical protein
MLQIGCPSKDAFAIEEIVSSPTYEPGESIPLIASRAGDEPDFCITKLRELSKLFPRRVACPLGKRYRHFVPVPEKPSDAVVEVPKI